MGFLKIYSFLFEIDFFRSYNRYRRVIIYKALEPSKSVILGHPRIWFVTGKMNFLFPFFLQLVYICYKTFQTKNHFHRGTWHHFYNFLNFFCRKTEHCVNLLKFCWISLDCNTFSKQIGFFLVIGYETTSYMLSKKSSLVFQFFLVKKLWAFLEIKYFFKKTSALSGQYLINQRALKVNFLVNTFWKCTF